MILIAESGSTKTEWRIIDSNKNTLHVQSAGINPYHLKSEEILKVMQTGLEDYLDYPIDEVYFYGAGCSSNENKKIVHDCFLQLFPQAETEVNHDLLAAARSLCGTEKGIACILGTGSNSCLYDGVDIIDNVRSLGYILGDEGSGNHLGKQFLIQYFKKELSPETKKNFDKEFGLEPHDILKNIYQNDMPVLFFSGFSKFIHQHLHDPKVSQMVYDSFRQFVELNVLKYTDYATLSVYFTGSVAFHYADLLRKVGEDLNVNIKDIVQRPVDGLVAYHQK